MDRNLWTGGFRVSQLVKTFLHLGFSPLQRCVLSYFLSFFSFFSLFLVDSHRCNARFITRETGSISGENYSLRIRENLLRISVYDLFLSFFTSAILSEISKASFSVGFFSTNSPRLFSFFLRTFSTKCQIVIRRILRWAWFYRGIGSFLNAFRLSIFGRDG